MSANSKAPPAHGAEESHTMDALARAMPLVLSAFMHVGVALVILFLGIMVAATPPEPMGPPPGVELRQQHSASVVMPERLSQTEVGRSTQKLTPQGKRDSTIPPSIARPGERVTLVPQGEGGRDWFPTGPPRVEFIDRAAVAHHVVFVIDCSGSMLSMFDTLRLQMLMSIALLDPNQQDFHVILFSSGRPVEGPARRLVPATRGNKLAACKFLSEVYPRKLTDPLPALKRAFDVMGKADARPGKVIWLLTDSEFPDSEKVLQLVRARNADKSVAVYTFLYGNREAIAEKVMRTIAAETNGKFTFISGEE